MAEAEPVSAVLTEAEPVLTPDTDMLFLLCVSQIVGKMGGEAMSHLNSSSGSVEPALYYPGQKRPGEDGGEAGPTTLMLPPSQPVSFFTFSVLSKLKIQNVIQHSERIYKRLLASFSSLTPTSSEAHGGLGQVRGRYSLCSRYKKDSCFQFKNTFCPRGKLSFVGVDI